MPKNCSRSRLQTAPVKTQTAMNSATRDTQDVALTSPWLTEREAAEYAKCSLGAFRRMRLVAYNSGGRKVYFRSDVDAALFARPWSHQVETPPALLSSRSNLRSERIRPYKPRTPHAAAD